MKDNKKSVIPKQWKDKYVCLKCGTDNKPTKGGSISHSGRTSTVRCYQCNKAVDTYNGSRLMLLLPIIMGPVVGIIAALGCVIYFIYEYNTVYEISKLMGTEMEVNNFIIQIIILIIPIIFIALYLLPWMIMFLFCYRKHNNIKTLLENLNKIEGLAEDARVSHAVRY